MIRMSIKNNEYIYKYDMSKRHFKNTIVQGIEGKRIEKIICDDNAKEC